MIYANDCDRNAVEWLSSLPMRIDAIDGRSITEVCGGDLRGYTQYHFFAGIGGWPLALQMAGWPADEPVWTGSCPCQPFSAAGKRKGTDDERHLWPEFYRLIAECRPPVVFGEQVASKDGRAWLAVVRDQMETLGYAVGAADLCAAGVGAPHIRQRLFWVADRSSTGLEGRPQQPAREERQAVERSGDARGMADAMCGRRPPRAGHVRSNELDAGERCQQVKHAEQSGLDGDRLGDTESDGPAAGAWSDVEYIPCRDGKARPVKPGIRVLANGVPKRVAQLRGLGNAIVPQVAAEFIMSYMEARKIAEKVTGDS